MKILVVFVFAVSAFAQGQFKPSPSTLPATPAPATDSPVTIVQVATSPTVGATCIPSNRQFYNFNTGLTHACVNGVVTLLGGTGTVDPGTAGNFAKYLASGSEVSPYTPVLGDVTAWLGYTPQNAAAANANNDALGAASAAQAASLQKSNNLSDLTSAASARTSLGLGSAATTASNAYDAAGAAAAVAATAVVNNAANTITASGAASTPAMLFNGSYFTGGTGTTTEPFYLFQPSGATAATSWSTSGTVIGVNAASGFTGNLIDVRVNGGNTAFQVSAGGSITVSSNIQAYSFTSSNSAALHSIKNNGGPPTASVTGAGCTLGTVTGGSLGGSIAVTGGGTCTVTLTWASAAYTNGASCGPLRDVTSGVVVQDVGAVTATATTFPALAMTTSDVLRYGPCMGY